jgi:hypothetical protein
MRANRFLLPALGLAASLAFSSTALAVDGDTSCGLQKPGSLLLYPSFDSSPGSSTVITVTNTNDDVVNGTVNVEFIYIDGRTCLEFNRTRTLTANDTLTVLAAVDNPVQQQGYLYVFAKSPTTGRAITWNYLIGNLLDVDAFVLFDWSVNAISFEGLTGNGSDTNVDGDTLRDLNGVEYSQVADEILIPRFFGQGFPIFSELLLINLTGGSQFDAVVNFLIYNDNEEVFSAQYQFRCWDFIKLNDINNVFDRDFLLSTNHNPFEVQGVPGLETGWMRIDGAVAFSTQASFQDPAIVAMLVEQFWAVATFGTADLPFGRGAQDNGDLLSNSIFGDVVN